MKTWQSVFCFVSVLAMSLCRGDTLFVEVKPFWNGEAIEIPSTSLRSASGETLRFTRLTFLLSKPSLKNEQGQRLGIDDWYAFLDLSVGTTPLIFPRLPAGTYTSLGMHLGLDEKTNQADPNHYPAFHPLNPLVNQLHWSPQGGYIFMAVEGFLEREGQEDLGFAYHVGNAENHRSLNFDMDLDITADRSARLSFHLNRLFEGQPPLEVAGQSSTHSRPDDPLNAHFRKQISQAFTLSKLEGGNGFKQKGQRRAPLAMVGTPYRFTLPKGFPIPALPQDVPLSNERVALGRRLFHDPILSGDDSMSCVDCHQPDVAFTDLRKVSMGVGGESGTRNSMPLVNLAWKTSFFWDGRAPSLRKQVLDPIQNPLELHSDFSQLVKQLDGHEDYAQFFAAAYGDEAITAERVGIALEQFLLTLTSFDSRFDQAAKGKTPLTELEKRGFELFMTEYDPRREQFGADCFHCHGGGVFHRSRLSQ